MTLRQKNKVEWIFRCNRINNWNIFAFLFILTLLNSLVKKMRNSVPFSVFLDAINVADIALIIAICFQMSSDVIIDWRTVFITLISIMIAFNFKKINSAFIVLGGSLLGYILTFIH